MEAVGRVLPTRITWISVALAKGRILIARLTMFSNIQRVREVLGVYMIQKGDVNCVSNPRPQCRSGTGHTVFGWPNGPPERRKVSVIAREVAHLSAVARRPAGSRWRRSQIDLIFIE